MRDICAIDEGILTLGQSLQPTPNHHPIIRYVHPEEFAPLKEKGLAMSFRHAESGPMVRSSYHAEEQSEFATGHATATAEG